MTEKEKAERLREVASAPTLTIEGRRELTLIADELDPPRPEPGTVVIRSDGVVGFVSDASTVYFHNGYGMRWDKLGTQWKPARIAGPMQEIVDIPPTKKWGSIAEVHIQARSAQGGVTFSDVIITRLDAERREVEG